MECSWPLIDLLNCINLEYELEPPLTSTPVKRPQPSLNPNEFEPPKKRLHGEGCKKRQQDLQTKLREYFVESPEKCIDRIHVMEYLGTDSKSLTTRAVKSSFPSAVFDRRKQQYRNIRRGVSFGTNSEESDLQVSENSEIFQLQQTVLTHKQKAKTLMDEILSNSSVKGNIYLRTLISMYNTEMESVSKISSSIDSIYERELNTLLLSKNDPKVSVSEREAIVSEYEKLMELVNLGIRTGENSAEEQITATTFANLKLDFTKECPMLTEIVQCLFPDTERTDRKSKCAIHALSLLTSLRNRHCRNDISLMFTIMLVSYGAGCRMINTLNKCGLTVHWDTLMNFLDKQLKAKMKHVATLTPQEMPLLLLMDNVNIYQGNKRHHRLFTMYGDNMWNFTVRGMIVPYLEGLEELFSSKETAAESQYDVKEFTFKDISLENNQEHHDLWNKHVDSYLVKLLQIALNISTTKPFKEMSEEECNSYLSSHLYNTGKTDLKIPEDASYIDLSQSSRKTKTVILPLSLENNSTLAGTCVILDQFAKEFSVSSTEQSEKLPFDTTSKTFCLKQAREHAQFTIMMQHHVQEREKYSVELLNTENDDGNEVNSCFANNFGDEMHKERNCDGEDDGDADDDIQDRLQQESRPDTTMSSIQKIFESQDTLFHSMYDSLKLKLLEAIREDTVERFVKEIAEKSYVRDIKDHLGRTLLHAAVEQLNVGLVECLLRVGCNPNAKEKCGVTPLVIAIILKSEEICQLLVNSRACVRGPLFTNVPSPISIARKMELTEILEILNPSASDEEDKDLCMYDPVFQNAPSTDSTPSVATSNEESSQACKRSSPGFITGVVGDVGTCKTNRGVMSRSCVHDWVGIIPGDLHTKGYLAEACFKEQSPGGFHYLISKVMKRKKLTREAFKKNKFSEGNLGRIREAVRDGAKSYGLAAAFEFKNSSFYPDSHMLSQCYHATGNHTKILLQQFKLWICKSNEESIQFNYRSRMFLFYGPLFDLFDLATRNCWGLARETCFINQLPVYAQLNFRNYYSECFIHIVNFLGKWPLAFRKMLQLNCSVNVTGKKESGIELDAYVESEIVQPLKTYVSGTVQFIFSPACFNCLYSNVVKRSLI